MGMCRQPGRGGRHLNERSECLLSVLGIVLSHVIVPLDVPAATPQVQMVKKKS